MSGLLLLAFFYGIAGFWEHREKKPKNLMPGIPFLMFLCMIRRDDGKMSIRGVAFQVSAYILIIGALTTRWISNSDAKIFFSFYLFCFLIVGQFVWIRIVAPRWFKE